MIIDSHCHLDYEPLINDINQVLLNAKNNNAIRNELDFIIRFYYS